MKKSCANIFVSERGKTIMKKNFNSLLAMLLMVSSLQTVPGFAVTAFAEETGEFETAEVTEQTETEEQPAEAVADEQISEEETVEETVPEEEPAIAEETPEETAVPAEETPEEEPAIEKTPEETAVPAEETPEEEPAIEETPEEAPAAEEVPTEELTVTDDNIEETPVPEETPAAEEIQEKIPAEETAVSEEEEQEDIKASVVFTVTPEDAVVTVKQETGTAAEPEADGTYLLSAGKYTYIVEAEGFVSAEGEFEIAEDNEEKVEISVDLEEVKTEEGKTEELSEKGAASPAHDAMTSADMSGATQISANTTVTAFINSSQGKHYFKFVPATTATYIFTSSDTRDTYGFLYDSAGAIITYNDDGAGNGQFKIQWDLTVGTTYYFGACYYSDSNTGSFPVTLTQIKTGWNQIGNDWYYYNSDGSAANGLLTINGKQYYFYSNGKMAANTTITYNGKIYSADSNGYLTAYGPGWHEIDDYWYYVGNDGNYVTNLQTINGSGAKSLIC